MTAHLSLADANSSHSAMTPTRITFCGVDLEVKNWDDVRRDVANALYRRDCKVFASLPFFRKTVEGKVTLDVKIFNAEPLFARLREMLNRYGIPWEALIFHFAENNLAPAPVTPIAPPIPAPTPQPMEANLPSPSALSEPLPPKTHDEKLRLLMERIATDYPTGFDFSPMVIRLWGNKVGFPIDDQLQNSLQARAFKCGNTYLLPAMIADDRTLREITELAAKWARDYGGFAVAALFERYRYLLKNLPSLDKFADFVEWHCSPLKIIAKDTAPFALADNLAKSAIYQRLSSAIVTLIEDAGGRIAETKLLEQIPALDAPLLAKVIKECSPLFVKSEDAGVIYWQDAKAPLPTDFREQLTATIEELEQYDLSLTVEALHTALSLRMQCNFMDEYSVPDYPAFQKIIADHISGRWRGGVFTFDDGPTTIAVSGTVVDGEELRVDFSRTHQYTRVKPTYCRLDNREFHATNWRDLWMSLIRHFCERHTDKMETLKSRSLPGATGEIFLIQEQPTSDQGNLYKFLPNGYWVYANYSTSDILKLIYRLCQHCGVDDLEIRCIKKTAR